MEHKAAMEHGDKWPVFVSVKSRFIRNVDAVCFTCQKACIFSHSLFSPLYSKT